jgi:uncharacterized protein
MWRALIRVVMTVGSAMLAATLALASPGDVVVGGIAGTLTAASGQASGTAVLLIAGSGPTDRDGNSPQGLKTDTYRQLATAFAAAGHASFRYDKRGVAASREAAGATEAGLTIERYAADVVGLVGWLRQQSGVRRVVLAGHSEGALLALMAAQRVAVDGVILLTPAGRPLGVVLREQLARQPLPGEVRREAERVLTALEGGGDVGTVLPPLDVLFRPATLPFLRSVLAVDPLPLLKATAVPAMVVGAGRDLQLARADFDRLSTARPDIIAHWEAEATHTLKPATADDPVQLKGYGDPTVPIVPAVSAALLAFLAKL